MVNYCAVFVPDGGFAFFSRLALRLAGLLVHCYLRMGSPDKARQAPPPGKQRTMLLQVIFPVALR
ncbi:hypothetical protein ACMYSL_26760 [Klebsiella sp. MISC125]|uniref:hypothetical protein n=1 Tax=Klebsiella sp. MISC125 TaxID=2755386 RepID=UPI003DAA0462